MDQKEYDEHCKVIQDLVLQRYPKEDTRALKKNSYFPDLDTEALEHSALDIIE